MSLSLVASVLRLCYFYYISLDVPHKMTDSYFIELEHKHIPSLSYSYWGEEYRHANHQKVLKVSHVRIFA